MRALIFVLTALGGIVCMSGCASAQAVVIEEARLSKLTVSAFECALLTADGREANRLLEIGHTAGRAFIGGISNLTKIERMRLAAQMHPLWKQVWDGVSQSVVAKPPHEALSESLWGPTSDFILGRIFSDRAAWATTVGDASKKADRFRERQCISMEYHRSHHTDAPTYVRSWNH